jgi:hypothetical protein
MAYDTVANQMSLQKFHVDDSYLEYVLEAGMIGLALALLPQAAALSLAAREVNPAAPLFMLAIPTAVWRFRP